MKSKEDKRIEADIRASQSTFKAPENPCCKCKSYTKPRCSYHSIFVPRKSTCENFKRAK